MRSKRRSIKAGWIFNLFLSFVLTRINKLYIHTRIFDPERFGFSCAPVQNESEDNQRGTVANGREAQGALDRPDVESGGEDRRRQDHPQDEEKRKEQEQQHGTGFR
ncbi:hypothetical protein HMI54_009407 [Coelomomyces lativittatus]|nr:hypothetical protein HMI54_009407 [Coelomomyces lativittatus]